MAELTPEYLAEYLDTRLQPIEAAVHEHSVTLGQHSVKLDDLTLKLEQHSVTLEQHSVKLDDVTLKQEQHSVTLGQHSVTLEQHSVKLDDVTLKLDNLTDIVKTLTREVIQIRTVDFQELKDAILHDQRRLRTDNFEVFSRNRTG